MAGLEKLNDNALDGVSGGQKYSIGNIPVPVHAYPGGPILVTLHMGDFLDTDGQTQWHNGTLWYHVYTAYCEGCIEGFYLQ